MRKKRIREERCDQRSKKKGVRIGRQSHCSRAEGESEMSTIISSSSTSSLWAAIIQKCRDVFIMLQIMQSISRRYLAFIKMLHEKCLLVICVPCLALPAIAII